MVTHSFKNSNYLINISFSDHPIYYDLIDNVVEL
jgi:hypothetical protein